jgi:S1-C subfamily serine protease
MSCPSWFLMATCFAAPALVQQIAMAKSPTEVGEVATAITVEMKSTSNGKVGSGILLQRQGDVYTVLTAAHVLKGSNFMTIKTADGITHRSLTRSMRQTGNGVDLATIKFQSSNRYQLAKIGTSNSLKLGSVIYVAGFPTSTFAIEAGILNFTKGEVIGNAVRGNSSGYSLLYSNITRSGMSGGPVLNENGELVAIHGQGDREGTNGDGDKTGRNLGIVVERFGRVAGVLGVQLSQTVAALPSNQSLNATDYLLKGNEKYDRQDFRGALADYSQAISLNSQFASAYNNRGNTKTKLNDYPGALADFNRAIAIDPREEDFYHNRGLLHGKFNKLREALADFDQVISMNERNARTYNDRAYVKQQINDFAGALTDYNLAIALDQNYVLAHINRGALKQLHLGDFNGALADYSRTIVIDPKNSNAYYNRGYLKATQLADRPGAIADFRLAAKFY